MDRLSLLYFITFRVSRRPREMYCGHARLCVCVCVCVSAAASPHYCTDPDVTWGMPPSCALLGRFAIGARVALLWQHYANALHSPAVIRQAHRTHAAHAHYTHAGEDSPRDKMDAPTACAVPFRPLCGGVVTRTRNVSE